MGRALFAAVRRALSRAPSLLGEQPASARQVWSDDEILSVPGLAVLLGPEFVTASDEVVTDACLRVAEDALSRERPLTARSFARAASLVSFHRPDAALTAAAAMTISGSPAQSEVWLRRAVTGARQNKDWIRYIEAYLRLATLFSRAGRDAAARAALLKASRAAVRKGLYTARAHVHLVASEVDASLASRTSEEGERKVLIQSASTHLVQAERLFVQEGGVPVSAHLERRRHLLAAQMLVGMKRADYQNSLQALLAEVPQMDAATRAEVLPMIEKAAKSYEDTRTLTKINAFMRRG